MLNYNAYEKTLVIDNKLLKYNGLFRADELFSAINKALESKGYTKREKQTEETVTEAGKKVYVELRPYKEVGNYAVLMIKIKINLDNITEAAEEVKEEKRIYQNGNINIYFDAWFLTDYYHRWEMKPIIFFLKGLVNKYLYKLPIEGDNIQGTVAGDTAYIFAQVKKLLNSYKIETEKFVSEEDVKKQMEEEIKVESEKEEPN
jgi:hypothetical protein